MGYDIIVRFQNEYYTKKSDLINLLAYVAGFGKKKQKILYVGTNGLSKDYVKAERQMKKVKKYYNKCDKRVAYHLVVSFPETIQNESLVIATSKRIAKELFSDYQVYYVVHGTKKNLHIHFVINSVSYIVKNSMSCHSSTLTHCHKLIHLSVTVFGGFTSDFSLCSSDHFMVSNKTHHMFINQSFLLLIRIHQCLLTDSVYHSRDTG